MDSQKQPLIALTCPGSDRLPRSPVLYLEALEEAGGMGVFVPPSSDPREVARCYTGFMISGGRDPLPGYYGQAACSHIDPEDAGRTEFELSLLHEIILMRKPLMGICYGMQVINIFFKGTLIQDIGSQMPGALDHRQGSHTIRMEGSGLAPAGTYEVNTSHHQAVENLGAGLRPLAFAADGVLEAFTCDGYPFLVGLQWHPERQQGAMGAGMFRSFMEACLGGK